MKDKLLFEQRKNSIRDMIYDPDYIPLKLKEMAYLMDVPHKDRGALKEVMDALVRDGSVELTAKGKYIKPENHNVTGVFTANARGFGFVTVEGEEEDIFIPATQVNGALHKDIVKVKVTKRSGREGKRREGMVLKILERGCKTLVGTFQKNTSFGFVLPDDRHYDKDIFISKKDKNGANHGDIVIAEVTKWPDKRRSPEGVIKEVLGKKGEKGLDILTIIKKHGLPEEFPAKVLAYAEGIPEEIDEKEIKRRKDIRNIRMVTIDGEDAKDLDDAVSIEKLENGKYKLGVHIADVSHYVKEKNPLDKEALKRATSVYLIDRVIPMLPKKLSNGICSLNPKVDRLALSCFMIIDNKGKVCDHEIAETVIRTSERMTYTDVTKILRDNDEELIKKYDYLVDDFKTMEELCLILREKRMKRGAIDFDFEESKIILNNNGKPIDIKPYEREIANRIIEEFMLVCNETIAEHMFWTNLPFVYRVHENPDEEKLEKFREFIYNLGYTMKVSQDIHPRILQEVLEKVKGKKEETVVSTLLLRSMMKAKYTPECSSHFGLAATYYCHFTSPIRRYPDLQIHRIIKEYLNGKIDEKRITKLTPIVDIAAKQSSEMERLAEEAEREVDDLKKAEYMMDRIGEEFEGIISSVTSFGIFVELPNTVEGLVHINDLDDDYYIYDEQHLMLLGQRNKKVYRLGDSVKVKCSRVDIDNREVFFDIVESEQDLKEIVPSEETASIIAEIKKEFGTKQEDN